MVQEPVDPIMLVGSIVDLGQYDLISTEVGDPLLLCDVGQVLGRVGSMSNQANPVREKELNVVVGPGNMGCDLGPSTLSKARAEKGKVSLPSVDLGPDFGTGGPRPLSMDGKEGEVALLSSFKP